MLFALLFCHLALPSIAVTSYYTVDSNFKALVGFRGKKWRANNISPRDFLKYKCERGCFL